MSENETKICQKKNKTHKNNSLFRKRKILERDMNPKKSICRYDSGLRQLYKNMQ